jgi:hypothetical protein
MSLADCYWDLRFESYLLLHIVICQAKRSYSSRCTTQKQSVTAFHHLINLTPIHLSSVFAVDMNLNSSVFQSTQDVPLGQRFLHTWKALRNQ